jgi:L-alanine-DL-glutamate epimerase-like enolase superfamily enzyme
MDWRRTFLSSRRDLSASCCAEVSDLKRGALRPERAAISDAGPDRGSIVPALEIKTESWPFKTPFRISGYTFTAGEVITVTLTDEGFAGRGEASGVYYHNETPASLTAQIESMRDVIESGINREALQNVLPPGGARCAIDCALWDLDSKRAGVSAWKMADVPRPVAIRTTFTVGAGTPDEMAAAARSYERAKAVKLKLTAEDTALCVAAVRAARPDVWIGVDANQAFTRSSLEKLLPALADAQVGLIEQPLPVGADAELEGLNSPIPIAADESVCSFSDMGLLAGRYDVVNIKLDKCGGLTEGLAMAREARRMGLNVMVGCMAGTSLSMAPAFVLGQLCDFVDLDGPTFLANDRAHPAVYTDGTIWCPESLWGGAA